MREFILTRKPNQWLALLVWVGFVILMDYVDWTAGRYLIVAIQTIVYVGIFIAGSVISHSGLIKIKYE